MVRLNTAIKLNLKSVHSEYVTGKENEIYINNLGVLLFRAESVSASYKASNFIRQLV